MTTYTELYSYREAWDKAAELQRRGNVTRVWFDGSDWRVGYWTRGEWRETHGD